MLGKFLVNFLPETTLDYPKVIHWLLQMSYTIKYSFTKKQVWKSFWYTILQSISLCPSPDDSEFPTDMLNLELLQRHYPFDPQDLASCGNDVKGIFFYLISNLKNIIIIGTLVNHLRYFKNAVSFGKEIILAI